MSGVLKLQTLYQRRKGRDLFDLWLCLEQRLIDPQRVVDCFLEYMNRDGHILTRAQFEQNLQEKEADTAFLSDIRPLLRPGLHLALREWDQFPNVFRRLVQIWVLKYVTCGIRFHRV